MRWAYSFPEVQPTRNSARITQASINFNTGTVMINFEIGGWDGTTFTRLESQTVSLSGSDAADILNTKGEMNMSVQDSFQVAIFEKLKNMGKIKAGSAV